MLYANCITCYRNHKLHDLEKTASSLVFYSNIILIYSFIAWSVKASFSIYGYPHFEYFNLHLTTMCTKYTQTQTFLWRYYPVFIKTKLKFVQTEISRLKFVSLSESAWVNYLNLCSDFGFFDFLFNVSCWINSSRFVSSHAKYGYMYNLWKLMTTLKKQAKKDFHIDMYQLSILFQLAFG